VEAERAMLRSELAREINAETEFTGALLRKVRESLGTDLEVIASRTKISLPYLRAIESEDFAGLPAFVYARGFVHEVARCLNLDPTQVTRTYLKRFREWLRATQGQGG
jgi:flagellar biosynthesis protein FlhG